MLPSNIGHAVESNGIPGAPLQSPTDRRVSSSSATTSTTTTTTSTTATTVTAATGIVSPDGIIDHPPPLYSNHPDAFAHHQLPPQPHPIPLPLSAVPLRRRRSSKLAMSASVRRGTSTPNLRDLAGAEHAHMSYGSASASSKSRNKLGYHRTSVACGHCRRRKIRCLLAQDDPQGRCSNCIRLKKECNFFPVDQQPPVQRPTHLPHKQERVSSNDSSSASSSPPNQHGLARDGVAPFHPYPSDSSAPVSAGFPAPLDLRQRTGSATSSMSKPGMPVVSTPTTRPPLPHMATAPPLSAGFDPARDRPPTLESSPYLDQSPMSNGHKPVLEDPSASFYRLAESPVPPSVPSFHQAPQAPYNLPMIHHRESVSTYPYGVPREDMTWSLPSRSMSYGQLEGLAINHSHPYPSPQYYKHGPPPPLYPPPDGPAHYPVTSTPAEPASAPADGRGGAPPNGHFAMHPPWHPSYSGNTIGGMTSGGKGGAAPGAGAEGYGTWYPESNRLSQVEEEVNPGPLNEDVSTFYQGTAQSANS